MELLRAGVNWERLIAEAWRHGVLPLLFGHLRQLGRRTPIPDEAMHRMRQGYVRAAVRNQAHFAAIAVLIERAAAAKLEVILLKGAALAQTAYRDPALRPFADVDLLVRAEEIDRAKELLFAAGYELAPELLSERFNRKFHANLPFVRRGERPVHIELHWKLSDAFSGIAFDYKGLFDRAELALAPEDTLIYLATHLDNHGYLNRAILEYAAVDRLVMDELSQNRLIWFTDLHEIVCSQRLDWRVVQERAVEFGATTALAVTLRLLRKMFGTSIDLPWLDALPMAELRWPERKTSEYVFALGDDSESEFFRRTFLATRKSFELRPIRLLDLWAHVFPARTAGKNGAPRVSHAFRAVAGGTAMFAELIVRRVARRLRQRTT